MTDTASWRPIEKRQARGEFPFAEILNVREDGWSQQINATLYLKGGGGVYA